MGEPVLLVGETGCGKTTTVQVLASHLDIENYVLYCDYYCRLKESFAVVKFVAVLYHARKTLHVVNLSQQSESSDLFGGYKPLDLAHNMKKFKEQYMDLFCRSFSSKKNEKFLNHTCYETNNWKILLQLMLTTIKKFLSKQEILNSCILLEWLQLNEDLRKISHTLHVAKENLLFSFVQDCLILDCCMTIHFKGILTRSIKNGEWILLDEINLASAETLDCLNTILDTKSSLGLER
uniref:ATPase dynein-related AAA domain-containing protein n=1 Tax=Romanomermis culicivorax TaxID=13658 RepID=A0A915IPF9_ROMCU